MTPVSELAAVQFENLHLRRIVIEAQSQDLQRAHQQIQQEIVAHAEKMRSEVGADAKAQYDPQTKTFVLADGPAPFKAPARRQAKRAQTKLTKAGVAGASA